MRIFITVLIVGIVLGGAALGFYLLLNNSDSSVEEALLPSDGTQTTSFPTSGISNNLEDSDTATVAGIAVRKSALEPAIPEDAETAEEIYPLGETWRIILGSWSGSYSVFYNTEEEYFEIYLQQEPVSEVRRQAEPDFLQALSITKDNACRIWIAVYVDEVLNPVLAGVNYRLSFCEGALVLP